MLKKRIFSALAKYNSAADENYLTESFVFVLKELLERETQIGLGILNKLCFNDNNVSFGINEKISVSTQDVTEEGTPDIKISYELSEWKERLWFRFPLEKYHFFSLDKDEQLELVTKFLKISHAEA